MNREIIFRGKRVDNEEWVEGDLLQNDGYTKIREQEKSIKGFAKSFAVIPETIGQYTGLKDKNGKRIFEGDILKAQAYWKKAKGAKVETESHFVLGEEERVVERGTTMWTVEHKNYNSSLGFRVFGIDRRWSARLTWNKVFSGECEVIGNIHDSPELLEDK